MRVLSVLLAATFTGAASTFADQPYSAERCAALGVAETVRADARAPDAIRDAVRQVLTEPSYRANAHAFQQHMMGLPGPEEMVASLESLRPQART